MTTSTLNLSVSQIQTNVPITILRARGKLDAKTYLDLIAKSQEIYINGHRNLLVDLNEISEIGLAGLFALFYAAILFQENMVIEVEGGWPALHTMINRLQTSCFEHFRLLGSKSTIVGMLQQAGLPISNSLTTALNSFRPC